MIALLVVLAASAGHLHQKLRSPSAFCRSCHGEVGKAMANHAHGALDCGSCHDNEPWVGVALWLMPGRAKTTKHGQVELARCKSCHFDQHPTSKAAKSIGHQNHVTANVHLSCDKCHVLRRHQSPVDPRSCAGCHDKVKVHEHGMSEVACLSCHQFTKEGRAGDPGATGCPSCHGGKPSQPGQAITATLTKPITPALTHGNVNACRLCHEPHRPDPANRRHGSDCASCHKRVVEQHLEAKISAHANCAECHDVHGPRPKTPDLCARCHSSELGKAAEGKLAARHQGCSGCHNAHGFRTGAAQCIECHEPARATLAKWNAVAHADCLNCHNAHDGKNPAAACPRCHEPQRGHGHEKCTTCHEPHSDKTAAKTCAACHQPVFAKLTDARVEKHRACSSCHATHAAPQAPARCAGCHGKLSELVRSAAAPAHQSCSSCHQSHGFSASVQSCRTCHRAAELGTHRDGCTKCHAQHGPPGRQPIACTNCHQNVSTGRGLHTECRSCHGMHKQPEGGPACVACHRTQVAAANTWRPPPHQKCNSCHELHSAQLPKSCADCHAKESSQALGKGHSCGSCHEPHQTPNLSAGVCSSCHQKQASLSQPATPTHSDCIKCHQPHTGRLPSCSDCHRSQPGAHSFKGHRRCADCHASHQVKFGGKDQCLGCHEDKLNHYPKANACTACHLFR